MGFLRISTGSAREQDDMAKEFLKEFLHKDKDPDANYKTYVNIGAVLLHHDHVTKKKLTTIVAPRSFKVKLDEGYILISLADEKWIYATVEANGTEYCQFLTKDELRCINSVLSMKGKLADYEIFDVIYMIFQKKWADIRIEANKEEMDSAMGMLFNKLTSF